MRWHDWQHQLMLDALELARLAKGGTYPNPAVGALVVKGGRIVGRGFHRKWGEEHAEAQAMRDAGRACRGADLYVTLEPCNHYGKQPPCTKAVIASGIRRVFIPSIDPNPLVDGKGVRALRRAGIAVGIGLEAAAGRRLNEEYFKYMTVGLPFVTVKIAQTLDGKIATRTRDSKWITSETSRKMVRRMRFGAQALIVGRGTVTTDDPTLLPEPRRRDNYVRCVLDSELRTPARSQLARTSRQFPVICYCSPRASARRRAALERQGVRVRPVKTGPAGRLDLTSVLTDLAGLKVMHVWVEGGSSVFTSFVREGLADKLILFLAPKLMGAGGSLDALGDLGVLKASQCLGVAVDRAGFAGDDLVATLYPGAGRRPHAERPRTEGT